MTIDQITRKGGVADSKTGDDRATHYIEHVTPFAYMLERWDKELTELVWPDVPIAPQAVFEGIEKMLGVAKEQYEDCLNGFDIERRQLRWTPTKGQSKTYPAAWTFFRASGIGEKLAQSEVCYGLIFEYACIMKEAGEPDYSSLWSIYDGFQAKAQDQITYILNNREPMSNSYTSVRIEGMRQALVIVADVLKRLRVEWLPGVKSYINT